MKPRLKQVLIGKGNTFHVVSRSRRSISATACVPGQPSGDTGVIVPGFILASRVDAVGRLLDSARPECTFDRNYEAGVWGCQVQLLGAVYPALAARSL
jgi:hypothetical protein